jgi:hypothetical protein
MCVYILLTVHDIKNPYFIFLKVAVPECILLRKPPALPKSEDISEPETEQCGISLLQNSSRIKKPHKNRKESKNFNNKKNRYLCTVPVPYQIMEGPYQNVSTKPKNEKFISSSTITLNLFMN